MERKSSSEGEENFPFSTAPIVRLRQTIEIRVKLFHRGSLNGGKKEIWIIGVLVF